MVSKKFRIFVQIMMLDGTVSLQLSNQLKKGFDWDWRVLMGFMKNTIAAAALVAFSFGPANAAAITGSLEFGGSSTVNTTTDQITFGPAAVLFGSTGILGALFPTFTPISMRDVGVAISYANQDLTAGSTLGCGGGCLFTTTVGPNTLQFNVEGYSFDEPAVGGLTISGFGTLFLTGFDNTFGSFSYSSQNGLSFSATVAVPGPIVGAGLPGLIAACGALIALARRRRREQV